MRKTIRSHESAECSCPWLDYAIDPVGLKVTIRKVSGLAASKEAPADETKERELEGEWELSFDPLAPAEQHVLAITLDGGVEFVPLSKQRPVYYAHLAWVDPVTRACDWIAFEEDTQDGA